MMAGEGGRAPGVSSPGSGPPTRYAVSEMVLGSEVGVVMLPAFPGSAV